VEGRARAELAASGALFKHAIASLFRVTWGYLLGVLLGVPAGLLLGWSGRGASSACAEGSTGVTESWRTLLAVLVWVASVTGLHLWLNVDWSAVMNDRLPPARRRLNVAYIPVTCHLACPVTDYISRHAPAGNLFIPRMFQGFPEI
jgi:hypothetical protein